MNETMEQELATTAAQQPEPSDEQITAEAKFYYNQIGTNIIEFGKRLIIMKKRKAHGEWLPWFKDNFNLSRQMAANFMRCAERYGNVNSTLHLNQTQMFELLALPADETEQFIETKAAAGTPVEDMTVKKLREEVKQWQSRAEVNANAVADKEKSIAQMAATCNRLQGEKSRLQRDLDDAQSTNRDLRNQLRNQKPVIQAPADYEQIKRDVAKLRDEKSALQKKLEAARTAEVPADYHANKKRLAELDAKISDMQKQIDEQVSAEDYANVAQKLDAIYALMTDILNSRNVGRVVADYERNNPDRYHLLCAKFNDFIEAMEMR